MATLGDLVTVLYRPRQTMRRVLDGRDRWAPQVVALAFICASVNDADIRNLQAVLPGLGYSWIAIVLLGLIAGAVAWVLTLFVLSWIATFAGWKLGGVAGPKDVRAALAWGMVPVIWSVAYRLPIGLLARRFQVSSNVDVTAVLLDFLAQGGCSIVVVYLAFQLVFAIWCIWVASGCLGEAQQFSSAKGFANVAITLAVPLVIAAAAVAAQHMGM